MVTDTHAPTGADPAPGPAPGPEPGHGHEPGPDAAPALRRSRSRRMLAGVAGGLATRFDVDVSLVRVAFVVLAFAWGLGVVVYLAMWAIVPKEPAGDGDDVEAAEEPTASWLSFLLLAAVLAFGLLVVSSWWGGPRWGGAVGFLWLVLLFGLLVAAIGGGARRMPVRRVLAALLVAALSVVVLVVGAFLALVAWTGVPITGGVGERVYVPGSVSQVQSEYRLAAGSLTVDLARVRFPSHGAPRHVTASVAVGVVTVEVPPGVVVDVSAHSGFGNVISTPAGVAQFSVSGAGGRGVHPSLLLDVEAGIGQVRLFRVSAP